MTRWLALLAVALGLGACSDAPSEAEIRAAVEAHSRKALAGRGAFTGFSDFRKQGCVDSKKEPGAYDCYYAATIAATAGGKPVTVNGKARFWRKDGGLAFQDLGAQPK